MFDYSEFTNAHLKARIDRLSDTSKYIHQLSKEMEKAGDTATQLRLLEGEYAVLTLLDKALTEWHSRHTGQ